MVKKIALTQGQHTLVDDCDYEFLNQWKWHADYQRSINGFYARRNQHIGYFNGKKKQKFIYMHRLIMERVIGRELKKIGVIDHRNHDALDNRRENLRIVTNRQNTQNKKIKTSSKYSGVSWHNGANKWIAGIRLNGKLKHLGYFTDEREAAKAYKKAVHELTGELVVCELESAKEGGV